MRLCTIDYLQAQKPDEEECGDVREIVTLKIKILPESHHSGILYAGQSALAYIVLLGTV
jgi:hypothetical protein